MPRIDFGLETDSSVFLEDSLDYLASVYPGWAPSEGNLEVIFLTAVAQMAAEVRDVAAMVPDAVFRHFGASIMGLPSRDQTYAYFDLIFTSINAAGYTVPEGTLVNVRTPTGAIAPFITITEAVINEGLAVSTAVRALAVYSGTDSNGLTVTAANLTLVDALSYVAAVAPSVDPEVTRGGQNAETDEQYIARLSDEMTLVTPRPILPRDFEILAMRHPSVFLARAIDLYDPNTGSTTEPRVISLALIDAAGGSLSAADAAQVATTLQLMREINFRVYSIDATYTPISVIVDVHTLPNYDSTTVQNAVSAALTAYLNPANWAASGQDSSRWNPTNVMRYLEISQVINTASAGVDYINSLTVNGGTGNVTMTGVVALPTVGAITVTTS